MQAALTSAVADWEALASPVDYKHFLQNLEALPPLVHSSVACSRAEIHGLLAKLTALVSGRISEQRDAQLRPTFSAALKDIILQKSELCSPNLQRLDEQAIKDASLMMRAVMGYVGQVNAALTSKSLTTISIADLGWLSDVCNSFSKCLTHGLLPVPTVIAEEKIDDVHSVLESINASLSTSCNLEDAECRELVSCLEQLRDCFVGKTQEHFSKSLEACCSTMAIIQFKQDLQPGAVTSESDDVNRRIAAVVFTGTASVRQQAQARGNVVAVATCSGLEKVEMILQPAAKVKLLMQNFAVATESDVAGMDFSQEGDIAKLQSLVPPALPVVLKKLNESIRSLEFAFAGASDDPALVKIFQDLQAYTYIANGKAYVHETAKVVCKQMTAMLSRLLTFAQDNLYVDFKTHWLQAKSPDAAWIKKNLVKHPMKKFLNPAVTALKAGSKDINALKAFVRDETPYNAVATSASEMATTLTAVMQACLIAAHIKKMVGDADCDANAIKTECKISLGGPKANVDKELLSRLNSGKW